MSNSTREALAEFFGTFVLIVFGVGVVAQVDAWRRQERRVPLDQSGLGPGRDDGRVCRRRRVGRHISIPR